MVLADIAPILLIALAVAIFASFAFSRVLARRRPPGPPLPPVQVPPEEAELSEGPITACLRCGSPYLRQPRLSEGLIPGVGEGLVWMCSRCKWRGQPLMFDDVTAYRQFVKGLNEDAKAHPDEQVPP